VRDPRQSVNLLDYFRVRKAWEAKTVASATWFYGKRARLRTAGRLFDICYVKSGANRVIADTEVLDNAEQVESITGTVVSETTCMWLIAVGL